MSGLASAFLSTLIAEISSAAECNAGNAIILPANDVGGSIDALNAMDPSLDRALVDAILLLLLFDALGDDRPPKVFPGSDVFLGDDGAELALPALFLLLLLLIL